MEARAVNPTEIDLRQFDTARGVRGSDEARPGEPAIVARVFRLDPRTGRCELWKEIAPISPGTGGGIGTIVFSADGRTCFSNHHRYSSELLLADGLR